MVRRYGTLFWLLTMLFISCQKELCYHHPHDGGEARVRIEYHWDLVDRQPEVMRVWFYSLDGATSDYVFDVPTSGSGYVSLPVGHYRALTYNSDTDNIFERNTDDISTIEVFTDKVSLSGARVRSGTVNKVGDKTIDMLDDPNWMCRDYINDVEIFSRDGEDCIVNFTPSQSVYHVIVNVGVIHGLETTDLVRGALSGCAGSQFIGEFYPATMPSTIGFDGIKDGEILHGDFYVFGISDKESKYELTILFWRPNGNVYYTFDVTDQIRDAFQKVGGNTKIPIVIDIETDLNINIGNGSGFRIDVDGWEPIEIVIPLR